MTGIRRNDIIDLLLDEINKIGDEKTENGLKKEDIDVELAVISNAIIFFFAGFDTSSLTLATVIFSFLDKPVIQDRARQEIEDVVGDSKVITSDHLRDLKYLENVINEALRYYGITSNTMRLCTKDYKVPDTDFTIRKGMQVNVLTGCFAEECFFNPAGQWCLFWVQGWISGRADCARPAKWRPRLVPPLALGREEEPDLW